jgi:hypothetical protein
MQPEPSPPQPLVIGWKEYLAFPEWHLPRIRVKVDTGAFTSALDVSRYELTRGDQGEPLARLWLALNRHHPERLRCVHAPVLRTVVVSNSGGTREERPLIEAAVRLGPVHKRIRVTVTNRARMRFRMILGRQALAGSFVVDVSRKYLLQDKQPGR